MKHVNQLAKATAHLNDGHAPVALNCKNVFVRGKFLYDYEFFVGPRGSQKFRDKQADWWNLLKKPEPRHQHPNVFGYYRLTPFLMEGSKQIIFVNRGWQEGNKSIYETSQPDSAVKCSGIVVHGEISRMEPILGLQESQFAQKWGFYRGSDQQARHMRVIGLKKMAARLQTLFTNTDRDDHQVMQVLVNLRAVEGPKVVPAKLLRNPQSSYTTSCIKPEQNMMYAAEWLAMASGISAMAYGRKLGSLLGRVGRRGSNGVD